MHNETTRVLLLLKKPRLRQGRHVQLVAVDQFSTFDDFEDDIAAGTQQASTSSTTSTFDADGTNMSRALAEYCLYCRRRPTEYSAAF